MTSLLVQGKVLSPPAAELALPAALPALDAAVAVPSVTRELIASFREGLPALPTNPLGKLVTQYASAAEHQLSELQQQRSFRFAEDFWSPAENVWHSASRVAQAAAKGMRRETHLRAERRLVAAAELAEREMEHHAVTQIASAGEQVELLCFIDGGSL